MLRRAGAEERREPDAERRVGVQRSPPAADGGGRSPNAMFASLEGAVWARADALKHRGERGARFGRARRTPFAVRAPLRRIRNVTVNHLQNGQSRLVQRVARC